MEKKVVCYQKGEEEFVTEPMSEYAAQLYMNEIVQGKILNDDRYAEITSAIIRNYEPVRTTVSELCFNPYPERTAERIRELEEEYGQTFHIEIPIAR